MGSVWRVLVPLAVLALVWRAVSVRIGDRPPVRESRSEDPATGAVLIDLDDGADAEERARVVSELVRAIAPRPWPSGERGLGERLSEAAQLYRIRPPAEEVRDILALRDEPEVEGVERERTWSVPAPPPEAARVVGIAGPQEPAAPSRPGRFVPNDPYYRHQWHLDQIGMPEAWARERGEGVVVAVVDTGVLYRDHGRFRQAPDLAETRFVPGRDLVGGDDTPDDEHGHGTHVAGTVAQSTDNAVGVAGVAPQAAIMPVRVLDRRGVGGWGAVAAGIRWAADHGADVINLSLGGGMPSQTIRRAIDHAHDAGVVVVGAAGNTGRPHVQHPAAHPHVLAVGASRYDETLTFYSSHGPGLDLVAPGGDVRVDQNGDGVPDGVLQNTMVGRDPGRHDYVAWMGTSMAAPHVAGAAALLRGAGVHDPGAVRALLERTAQAKGERRRYGAGIVQAADALAVAEQGVAALRGAAAVLLGLGLLIPLARRRRLDVPVAPAVGWAVAVAGGWAVLPWHWVPGVGEPLADVAAGAAGLAAVAGPWGAPFVLGPLLPLVLVALLLGVRRARPAVVGAACGVASLCLVEAAWPLLPFAFGPPFLTAAWLVLGGLAAALVGRLAALRA